MAGTVVYPKENQKGCKEFVDFGISFQSKPGALPTFVLVDRGGIVSLNLRVLFIYFRNFILFVILLMFFSFHVHYHYFFG